MALGAVLRRVTIAPIGTASPQARMTPFMRLIKARIRLIGHRAVQPLKLTETASAQRRTASTEGRRMTGRRLALAAMLVVAMMGASAQGGDAQEYPNRDIHLIVGFPPGTGADILVRYFAEKLRPLAQQTVIVENKPGANSNIATEYVARAKPDGYTLYPFSASTVAATMHLYKNPPVDVGAALEVAGAISRLPFMLVVDAGSPYKTVAELTQAMKAKGAAASFATGATPGTIMGALYNQGAGLQAVEVIYRNVQDALGEMQSGKVDYGCFDPIAALGFLRQGKI